MAVAYLFVNTFYEQQENNVKSVEN